MKIHMRVPPMKNRGRLYDHKKLNYLLMKSMSTILLSLFLLMLPVLMYGQKPNALKPKSKVVMSEADISSLVKTLLEHRAAQSQVVSGIAPVGSQAAQYMVQPMYHSGYSGEIPVKDVSLENTLLKLHLTLLQEQIMNRPPVVQGQSYPVFPGNSGDDSQRIRDMQYEISRLQNRLWELSNSGSTPTTILPGTGQSAIRENIVTTPSPSDTGDEEKALAAMQQRMDSLMAVIQSNSQTTSPEVINYNSAFDSLQQKLAALKEEMAVRKESPTNYDVLRAKFTDYKREIYFANNSAELDANAAQIVEELKGVLEANNDLDVVLKGFASDKGPPLTTKGYRCKEPKLLKGC